MAYFQPPPKRSCVSATVGSKVYIWGGAGDTSELQFLYILDTVGEQWQAKRLAGPRPTGYAHMASAHSGMSLYVYGGWNEYGIDEGDLYCLDLEILRWRELSAHTPDRDGPKRKRRGGMAVHGNKLILFGGTTKMNPSGYQSTDELHVYDLSTGLWSSPTVSGTIPPAWFGHTFTKVNDSTVILFGGNIDDLYTLNITNMHWTQIYRKEPWPLWRGYHAASCLDPNTIHTQLIITGGADYNDLHGDLWFLDIKTMSWRKMMGAKETSLLLQEHTATIVQISEDVFELVIFGRNQLWQGDPISETRILLFEKLYHPSKTSVPVIEWKIVNIVSPDMLGNPQRIKYKKDLYDRELEKACQKVIEEQFSVSIYLARINFVGLPHSGKTTTLHRLIGKFLNIMKAVLRKELPSTGIAERNHAFIRSISKSFGFALNSQWSTIDLTKETTVVNQWLLQIAKDASFSQIKWNSVSALPSELEVKRYSPSNETEILSELVDDETDSQPRPVKKAEDPADDEMLSLFKKALFTEEWDVVKYLLEDTIYLISTDTGGQTAFLDLMSRFLMGPALNLIVSRLIDSLDQEYKVFSTNEDGRSFHEEDSVVTLEAVLFQALASIACMEYPQEADISSKDLEKGDAEIQIPSCSSRAIFVGTFRDMVTEEEFEKKDKILRQKLEQTEFSRNKFVEYASEKHLILALNNYNGSESEVHMMRKTFETVIKRNFKKVHIPASWLMLSIILRQQHSKRVISMSECKDIAAKLGIATADLPKALWFLHYRVGTILHYPMVEEFKNIIICDIQVVFDIATQLVKKTFTFNNIGMYATRRFKEKAQFSMVDLEEASKDNACDLIPLKKMVILMEHLKILAQLPPNDETEEPVFFMPSVLSSATNSELEEVDKSPHVAPLMIRYKCGYMPLGVFSSLIIELVSGCRSDWDLIEEDLRRNRIAFHVGDDCDTVTLVSYPTFMKVILFRESDPMRLTSLVCADIRIAISDAMKGVHSYLKYSSTATFQFAFECLSHPGKEHLCVLKSLTGNKLQCLQNPKEFPILKELQHRVWFHKKVEDEFSIHQCYEGFPIPSVAGRQLKGDDIGTIVEKLIPCAAKWNFLGTALNVPHGVLKEIEATPAYMSGAPRRYLIETIAYWLKNNPEPTVLALVEALRSRTVGEGRLAREFYQSV